MKPPFSSPADMGKREDASDSFDTFLTLMRTLEIVLMNRADFAKRQVENLEGKLSQYRSEALELSSRYSSFVALISQKSDTASKEIEQFFSKANTKLAGEKVLSELAEIMNIAKEEVDDVIDRVYRTHLLTIPSNLSRDLCGDFFKSFQLLESGINRLGRFDCSMDICLSTISMYLAKLMKESLMVSSPINPPSTDHNKKDTVGS